MTMQLSPPQGIPISQLCWASANATPRIDEKRGSNSDGVLAPTSGTGAVTAADAGVGAINLGGVVVAGAVVGIGDAVDIDAAGVLN
jgi:hypothetical protein